MSSNHEEALNFLELQQKSDVKGHTISENQISCANTQQAPSNILELDTLMEEIGFGAYHLKQIGSASLIALMDGAVIMTFSLTVVILHREWDYSDQIQSLIASLVFLAVVAGAYVSGPIADRYGRRKPMIISLLFIISSNIMSAFSFDVMTYTVTRCLLTFACGFYSPIGFTYILEVVPPSLRGKIVTLGNAMIFLGQLYICFIGLFTLDVLDQGNWRLMTILSTIPAIVSLVLKCFYFEESVRYLLIDNQFERAIRALESANEEAWRSEVDLITEEHKQGLRNWMEAQIQTAPLREEHSIKLLFTRDYAKITVILWFNWFAQSFVYYGLTLYFPYILNQITNQAVAYREIEEFSDITPQENNLGSLTLSVALESLSVIIAFFVIDRKGFGRKRAMRIFYTGACLLCLVAYFDRSRVNFILLSTLIKVILDVCAFYNYIVTLEVYPTQYRATGVGAATAVGKAGTILMPWICSLLLELSPFGPFLGFAFILAVASISIMSLDYSKIIMK